MTGLVNELINLINNESNNNPAPIQCEILKTYPNEKYVDVQTSYGILTYIKTLNENVEIGDKGVIVFIDGDENNPIIISNIKKSDGGFTDIDLIPYAENDKGIMCFHQSGGGGGSSTDVDISLDMDLQTNGYMKITAEIIEKIIGD